MASSDKTICTLCYEDGSSTEAVTWCTECEVFLCGDCGKHHTKSRASKDHKTMASKDYHSLPKFMLEISNQCRDHNKKFELYCSSHACPCCVQCVTETHKKCQEMQQLSDILKQVKSSASVQLLEQDLKDVKENFEEITKYLNCRIETSNIQKQKAAEKIRSIRKSIDDHLKKIEKNILDDLESKQSNIKSKINTLLQQLTQRANEISQLQSDFSKMTQYATELQMYICMREIEKTTSKAAKYIDDLKSGGNLEEKKHRTFDGYSSDTCFVRNNTVAFTIVSEKQIALVDLEKNEIIKTVGLSHTCCSVASDGQMLVISSKEKSTLVNLSDESHTILKVSANCVALFKGNIYGTLIVENKVCCYKSTGVLLWTFMHQDIDKIGGLALDKNGFVYIAGGNNSIVVVSPDGKNCKTILSKADGIKDPFAIDINREIGMMIVSRKISDDSEHDTAYVYKI
ncbi:unnamed protein product [Mytilus edulis]|uniref:B box-type domain-containing protein n=1 Tax=Mytilus edulis TaxID=6550 RepID=A0A8S3SGB2_MYTED|nr:unnamed protein product [Mytilus edulis]